MCFFAEVGASAFSGPPSTVGGTVGNDGRQPRNPQLRVPTPRFSQGSTMAPTFLLALGGESVAYTLDKIFKSRIQPQAEGQSEDPRGQSPPEKENVTKFQNGETDRRWDGGQRGRPSRER